MVWGYKKSCFLFDGSMVENHVHHPLHGDTTGDKSKKVSNTPLGINIPRLWGKLFYSHKELLTGLFLATTNSVQLGGRF